MNAKEEIKIKMAQQGLSYQDLADKLQMEYQPLYYALNYSTGDLDLTLYTKIMKVLYSKAPVLSCNDLFNHTLNNNSEILKDVARINDCVNNIVADNNITTEERNVLLNNLETIKEGVNTSFDALIKMVRGL